MGRQLFLHHYLPAHLASALVTGALLEFIFNVEPLDLENTSHYTVKQGKKGNTAATPRRNRPARERILDQSLLASWIATAVILIIVVGGWYYFLPLTYGYPGLTVEQVNARKWLGYDLHFAK
jgi:dolichyl-phosphate-mannose-protein mannosyltransferase